MVVEEQVQDDEDRGFHFGTSDLRETQKEPFVGEVSFSEWDCDCEDCQNGQVRLREYFEKQVSSSEITEAEMNEQLKRASLGVNWHVKYAPIDGVYEKEQSNFIPYKKNMSKISKYGTYVSSLEGMGVVLKIPEDHIGQVFELDPQNIKIGKKSIEMWIPVRQLEEDEIKAYKKATKATR